MKIFSKISSLWRKKPLQIDFNKGVRPGNMSASQVNLLSNQQKHSQITLGKKSIVARIFK